MNTADRLRSIALAIGFAGMSAGVLVARSAPATRFEPSIYDATPSAFWIATVAALAIAVATLVHARRRLFRGLSSLLGAYAVLSVVALPSLRGYAYTGFGDAMSYWGLARDIRSGLIGTLDILYPATMLVSIAVDALGGVGLDRALMLIPVLYAGVFLLGIPLVVRAVRNSPRLVTMATLSALCLLPINQISRAGVFLLPYPTTAALFFLPFVLCSIVYVLGGNRTRGAVLFGLYGITLLSVHPQQAANLLLLALSVVVLGPLLARILSIRIQWRAFAAPTAVFAIVFWLWVSSRRQFERSISGLVRSLLSGAGTTGDVGNAASSLAGIGSSLPELFVKIFLLNAVYVGLTAVCVVLTFVAVARRATRRRTPIDVEFPVHLTIGLLPVGLLFVVYIAFSSQYFRHLGFLMVVATVLGSFALVWLFDRLGAVAGRRTANVTLVVVFVCSLLAALPVVHMSPYIYQSNQQVTQAQLDGYDFALESADGTEIVTVRGDGPERFGDVLVGSTAPDPPSARSPDGFADRNLTGHYAESKLLVVTRKDRVTEVDLYDGFRFGAADFAYVETAPTIDTVYTSGDVTLYHVGAE